MTGRFPAEAAIHTALGGGCQARAIVVIVVLFCFVFCFSLNQFLDHVFPFLDDNNQCNPFVVVCAVSRSS